MEDYTFKKSTCERYDLRWEHGGWATFTIDENGGLFNCQSDYGSYNYEWPKHGRKSFKHFLIEITRGSDYLLGKVANKDHFDFQKAVEQWKSEIIKLRRGMECTEEQARRAWDFVEGLEEYSGSPQIIQKEIYESESLSAIQDEPWYTFEADLDYSPQALFFGNEIMPMFADLLKKEIGDGEKEKAPAPTEAVEENSHLDCTINLSKVESLMDFIVSERNFKK